MNYKRIYEDLIASAKTNNTCPTTYYEKHHILPKSMGGSDDQSNLVKLTPRQHFIAHRLLAKWVTGSAKYKMVKALHFMTLEGSATRWRTNSKVYESVRNDYLTKAKLLQSNSIGKPKTFLNLSGYSAQDIKVASPLALVFNDIVRDILPRGCKNRDLQCKTFTHILGWFLELYAQGFEGVYFSDTRSKDYSLRSVLDRLKTNRIILSDNSFNIEIFNNRLQRLSNNRNGFSKGNINKGLFPTLKNFSSALRLQKINNKTKPDGMVFFELTNVKVKGKQKRRPILRPLTNWLTLEHSLVSLFHRPLEPHEYNSVIRRIKIYQSGFTRKATQYIPEDLPEDFEITSIQKAA